MPSVSTADGEGTITCKITSSLSNSDITLSKLVANNFNDVTLGDTHKNIETGKTCEGTSVSNDNHSNNGNIFISFHAFLISFFFLIF